MIDFNKIYNVHFVGVGGVSMHSLALFCKSLGWKVSGSDIIENKYTEKCQKNGIKIFYGHTKKNINSPDFVVKTSAIKADNEEVAFAQKMGIKIYDRADFLNEILKKIPTVIAIAGTHGKSTTSAMLYQILHNAKRRVSCHIGADIDNARLNITDDIVVLEACEYNKNFLKLKVDVAVVLNVEKDHLECYGSFYQLKNAFLSFLKHAKNRYVFSSINTNYITLKNLKQIEPPKIIKNKFIFEKHTYTLDFLTGQQYVFDACVAIKIAIDFGVPYKIIYETLKKFRPINRRQQLIAKIPTKTFKLLNSHFVKTSTNINSNIVKTSRNTINSNNDIVSITPTKENQHIKSNVIKQSNTNQFDNSNNLIMFKKTNKDTNCEVTEIYIDYAHHPTEIKCNLEAFCHYNTLCIFQPHTFSRTKFLKDEFVSVLSNCDCIIYKEYSARETLKDGLSAFQLYKDIEKSNKTLSISYDKSIKGKTNEYCDNKKCDKAVDNCSIQSNNSQKNVHLIKYADNKNELKQILSTLDYEKIIFFGAGDIDKVAFSLCHDLLND